MMNDKKNYYAQRLHPIKVRLFLVVYLEELRILLLLIISLTFVVYYLFTTIFPSFFI